MFSRSSVKLQSARCHSILLNRLFQSSTWFLEYAVRVVGLCPALVISNQQEKREPQKESPSISLKGIYGQHLVK